MHRTLPPLVASFFFSSAAVACPLCHTPVGQQVREGIFNGSFGEHLLLVLAPLPVLAGVVAAVHFGAGRVRRPPRKDGEA